MGFDVINNPDFNRFRKRSGFKNSEFKQLAGLYSRAAIVKALYDISVDVDCDEGVCTFAYFRTNNSPAYLQFVIRRVGPFTDMYEVFKQGKGRIARSGIFARAFEKLEEEIAELMPEQS